MMRDSLAFAASSKATRRACSTSPPEDARDVRAKHLHVRKVKLAVRRRLRHRRGFPGPGRAVHEHGEPTRTVPAHAAEVRTGDVRASVAAVGDGGEKPRDGVASAFMRRTFRRARRARTERAERTKRRERLVVRAHRGTNLVRRHGEIGHRHRRRTRRRRADSSSDAPPGAGIVFALRRSEVSRERVTLRGADHSLDLRAAVIDGGVGELSHVDAFPEESLRAHLGGVNVENLRSSVAVGEANLHLQLQPARAKHGGI